MKNNQGAPPGAPTNDETEDNRINPDALEIDAIVRAPLFGSDDHLQWLARRLESNWRFRQQLEDFAALGEAAHRLVAREMLLTNRLAK